MRSDFSSFIEAKSQLGGMSGFEPIWMPDFLFDFQKHLCDWSIRKGKSALFEDCGMGKTAQQLVWSENVLRHTNKPVLILTPLAVSSQTVREADKFGVEARQCKDGKHDGKARILVTNYERLHHFNPSDFAGVVCDESSILKNFEGATKEAITEFMRMLPYRLLCTATAAPNDYIELGTSSEALGEMGFMDMLGRFFKQDNSKASISRRFQAKNDSRVQVGGFGKYRFRGHAERDFWRWVVSWARAVRKPSDVGFDNGPFILPPMTTRQHIVKSKTVPEGFLFAVAASNLHEQRQERRRTIQERCETAASLCADHDCSIAWCSLNDEADLLEEMIPGAKQIEGHSMSDDEKEEVINAFIDGQVKTLVGKPSMLGLGMNFQHCAHQTFFPSHSFEQFYQGTRRSWRFGQKREVTIDIVASEGEVTVLANLERKTKAAAAMFAKLVDLMGNELRIQKTNDFTTQTEIPSWLQKNKK